MWVADVVESWEADGHVERGAGNQRRYGPLLVMACSERDVDSCVARGAEVWCAEGAARGGGERLGG